MENQIAKVFNSSIQAYEMDWVNRISNDISKKNIFSNPSLSLFVSMVYGFALHLPYSMDIEQPEYVPADFLNLMPHDVDDNQWFKWEDRRTLFNAMVHWGDTFKTGMLLQVCSVFQKMILGQMPAIFELREEDYIGWGIESMTRDKEYNRCFFETIKSLPYYYRKLVSAANPDDRRKVLDEMYDDVMQKISSRFGGFTELDSEGNVVRESKGTILISPSRDIEMMFYNERTGYYDGIPEIIEKIKKEQLEAYRKIIFELPPDNQLPSSR